MKALVDLNVLLDVFLNRSPWVTASSAVLEANRNGKLQVHISAVTLPTLFYVVRRNATIRQANQVIEACLSAFEILTVARTTVELALRQGGSDFEDNLQIAAALEANLDAIVTRDAKGFIHSPVHVYDPPGILKSLTPPG